MAGHVQDAVESDGYVLTRSAGEDERLRRQARLWEPEAARALDRAGLGPGATCLDAGCGTGEVMRLMAERVGPTGSVTGIDVDARLGAQAIDMLHALGHHRCAFHGLDLTGGDPPPGAPFDLVFVRLVLLHVEDPAAVLRRLWDWVAPGGHLVAQDYDLLAAEVVPPLEIVDEFKRVAVGTFWEVGRDVRIGLRLAALHREAGIGVPDGIDAGVRVGPLPELAPMYEAVFRSVLPTAISLGLTTAERGERWLEAFARESADATGHTALWPPLIGTWKRKHEEGDG